MLYSIQYISNAVISTFLTVAVHILYFQDICINQSLFQGLGEKNQTVLTTTGFLYPDVSYYL